jgi:hypothetical protein
MSSHESNIAWSWNCENKSQEDNQITFISSGLLPHEKPGNGWLMINLDRELYAHTSKRLRHDGNWPEHKQSTRITLIF